MTHEMPFQILTNGVEYLCTCYITVLKTVEQATDPILNLVLQRDIDVPQELNRKTGTK
jgi:hypothetical protein